MFKKRRLIKRIRSVIEEVSTSLPPENVEDAIELLNHNEWGLALSLISDQLYEYDIPIDNSIYDQIERLGSQMKMPSSEWTMLKELIR